MERIDVESLRGQLNKRLDEIEDQFIGIDEIEDKTYMDDRGGLEEANRIAERIEQYGDDEESQVLRSLDEGFLKLKSVREAKIIRKMRDTRKEDAKKDFVSELEKEQEERNARIQEIDEKIEDLEKGRKEKLEIQEEHENAKKLLKNSFQKLDKKIFKDLDGSIKKYADAVKKKEEEIAILKQEKAELEEDNIKLDDLIDEINGVEKNIEKNEEENKETPEVEPAEGNKETPETEPAKENKETPETDPVEENKETPEAEPVEENNENSAKEGTEDNVAPGKREEAPTTNQTKYVYRDGDYGHRGKVDVRPPDSKTNPEEILSKSGNQIGNAQNDARNREGIDPDLGDLGGLRKGKTDALALKEIKVSISNEGKPVYSAIVVNGDKEEIITLDEDIHTRLNGDYVKHFEEVRELEKYLDPNIAELLMKVDKTYSDIEDTDKPTVEEIINASPIKALKNYKELLIGKSEGKLPLIDISYDFSELYAMPTDKDDKRRMKFIQKIAKTNYNKGLLKSYEGRPNILERIKYKLANVFAKRITSGTVDLDDEINPLTNDEIKELYDRESSKDDFNKVEFEKMLEENHIPLEQFKTIVPEYEPASEPSIREGKPTETPIEPTTETLVETNKPNDFKEGLKVSPQSLGNSDATVMSGNSENEVEVGNESSDHGEHDK